MLQSEWKSILKNKFLLIVVGVMVLIPALYNIIFLGAMWDPYGKLDKLPVAVVNNDQATEFHDKEISLGQNLVDKLKEKKSLDFRFVSSKDAEKGIDTGKYYMVVTIPENFSEHATTLLTDEPQSMIIDYQTTQGKNLTASKMAATAISELKNQVSTQVTAMYTETLLNQFGKVGTGMEGAATGSGKLETGVSKLQTASGTVAENLDKLSASSLTFSEGTQTLNVGLEQYVVGANQVNEGAGKLSSGLNTFAENVPTLVNGTNQLNTGAHSLTTGLNQYTDGVASLSYASSQLNSGIAQVTNGLPILTNGVTTLATGSQTLNTGLQNYTSGVSSVSGGSQQLTTGLTQLSNQTQQLPAQIHSLHEGTQQLVNSISQMNMTEEEKTQLLSYLTNVQTYITGVSTVLSTTDWTSLNNLAQSTTTVQTLSNDVAAISTNVTELAQQLDTVKATLSTSYNQDIENNASAVVSALSQSGVVLTEEQQSLILSTMQSQQSQTLTALENFSLNMEAINAALADEQANLATLGSSLTTAQALPINEFTTLQTQTTSMVGASQTATPAISQIVNGSYTLNTTLLPAVTAINQGVEELDENMPLLATSVQQLSAGSEKVTSGVKQLDSESINLMAGSSQLSSGLSILDGKTLEFSQGVGALSNGSTQIASGAEQLTGKSKDLVGGATQLSEGLSEVTNKMPALSSGINTLVSGSTQLTDGTSQLKNNGATLVKGSEKLTDGAEQISAGSSQLAEGEKKITDSFQEVITGLSKLGENLGTGAQQIGQINTEENVAKAIAEPINLKHKDEDKVANNGTAMAPYMMSVALFVGTLTVNMMFDAFTPKKKPTNGVSWWASKMSVLGAISVVQAFLVYFVLTVFLGMSVLSPVKVISFLLLEALTFMSIVTLFNLLLGKAGAFLMLIFMMLQLAGSGGTYPIQLSNGFYETLSPLLPMTYSIRALREGISIGGSMLPETLIFIVLLVISNGCMILYFNRKTSSFDKQGKLASIELS